MSHVEKGTVFKENRIGEYKLAYDELNNKFNFLFIFNLKSVLYDIVCRMR